MTGFRRQPLFLVLLLTTATGAYGQIPGAVQPGQIERQCQKPPEPRGHHQPHDLFSRFFAHSICERSPI